MLAKVVKCGIESFWIGGIDPTVTQQRGSGPICKFELLKPFDEEKLNKLFEICREDKKGFKIIEYTVSDDNKIVPFIEYNGCLINQFYGPNSSIRTNIGYFLSEKVVMGRDTQKVVIES